MIKRMSAAVATGVLASAVAVLGSALPASANTNYNGNCEPTEGCVFKNIGYNENSAGQGTWDYEGTDRDLRNNYFKGGGGVVVNDNGSSFMNYGLSCNLRFGNNPGTASTWSIYLEYEWATDASSSQNDKVSSMWWEC